MTAQFPKRDWFYWFITLFTATQLPISALILVDFVLHPLVAAYSNQPVWYRAFSALLISPMMVVIALLVIRRAPRNLTGLFLLLWATIQISETVRPETQILRNLSIGWASLWFLPLYFPDGRAFPHHFESIVRILFVGLVFSVIAWSLTAPQFSTSQTPNPLFISALKGLFPFANATEQGLMLITIFIIPLSLIARYRGGDQRVRQQLKWMVWVFFSILLSSIPILISGINVRPLETLNPLEWLVVSVWGSFILLAPFFAIAIAILRHKLYDIDIIIRRTLVYSVLTATLAAIYFGSVIVVQQMLSPLTESSDLAIALSTLAIAALFNPLRHRIQNVIDRRFFRRKYDAQKTLEAFSVAIRDQVDLESLQAALVGVVQDTMQPTKVGLWLRESEYSLKPDHTP